MSASISSLSRAVFVFSSFFEKNFAANTATKVEQRVAIVDGIQIASGELAPAAALTPMVEIVGSYITDMKLLELASLDRPLL